MTITRHGKKSSSVAIPNSSESTNLKQIDLLYVEDEDINWEVTVLHLKERYNVERAVNSYEAFALLKQRQYHAILMDIQLRDSELDGIGITEVLRGTYKGVIPDHARNVPVQKIPIIFMTAYSARYKKSDLVAKGGDELITKPIDFTHLSLCLSRCLLKNISGK